MGPIFPVWRVNLAVSKVCHRSQRSWTPVGLNVLENCLVAYSYLAPHVVPRLAEIDGAANLNLNLQCCLPMEPWHNSKRVKQSEDDPCGLKGAWFQKLIGHIIV